jgi:hypothetical protein
MIDTHTHSNTRTRGSDREEKSMSEFDVLLFLFRGICRDRRFFFIKSHQHNTQFETGLNYRRRFKFSDLPSTSESEY